MAAKKKTAQREADVPVNVYATRGEAAALEAIIQAWALRTTKEKDIAVPATRRAWFRDVIRREARAYGIEIVEPEMAPPEPPPATPAPKPKRGR